MNVRRGSLNMYLPQDRSNWSNSTFYIFKMITSDPAPCLHCNCCLRVKFILTFLGGHPSWTTLYFPEEMKVRYSQNGWIKVDWTKTCVKKRRGGDEVTWGEQDRGDSEEAGGCVGGRLATVSRLMPAPRPPAPLVPPPPLHIPATSPALWRQMSGPRATALICSG